MIFDKLADDKSLGLVLSRTRKYAELFTGTAQHFFCEVSKKWIDEITVGDLVYFESREGKHRVIDALSRTNLFSRHLGQKTRIIAANIDAVFVFTAPSPLHNTDAIDRILLSCADRNIPAILLLNKSDLLKPDEQEEICTPYEQLGVRSFVMQGNSPSSISAFSDFLGTLDGEQFVFTGISGVGKSTFLNTLLPEADSMTRETSERTGQGKQTTSQARGHVWPGMQGANPHIIIDLPGIQNFGVSHLTPDRVRQLFTDFHDAALQCGFSNCSHINEEDCGVKAALEDGEISLSRFESYVKILDEIEKFKPY